MDGALDWPSISWLCTLARNDSTCTSAGLIVDDDEFMPVKTLKREASSGDSSAPYCGPLANESDCGVIVVWPASMRGKASLAFSKLAPLASADALTLTLPVGCTSGCCCDSGSSLAILSTTQLPAAPAPEGRPRGVKAVSCATPRGSSGVKGTLLIRSVDSVSLL